MSELKHLKTALKGEYMAILSLNQFIKDESDSFLKDKYEKILSRHKSQAYLLKKRIHQLNGKSKDPSLITKGIITVKYKLSPKKYINGDILDTVIAGEEMGVDSLDAILNKLKDQDNKTLIQNIQFENKRIIEDLYNIK